MKIIYFKHSGFAVILDRCTLLFDYIEGDLSSLPRDQKLYVFVSHSHHDHYVKKIFELAQEYDVTYILSDDINYKNSLLDLHFIGVDQELKFMNISLRTLKSTDLGVAFCVSVDDKVIYHAGDLHDWYWEGENSDEENQSVHDDYINEIQKLKNIKVDVAFLVLDPRQEDQFSLGMKGFLDLIDVDYVFPMHLWEDYDMINKMKAICDESARAKIVTISHPAQSFQYKEGKGFYEV